MATYYLDSCIWRDHFDDRFGQRGKPLGKYATLLIEKIMKEHSFILYSRMVLRELLRRFPAEEVNDIFLFLKVTGIGKEVRISESQFAEAEKVSKQFGIPFNDAVHIVVARDNDAIFVSRTAG